MISPEDKIEIQGIVKGVMAHGIVDKKVCDTPLEAYDVVNKKYADSNSKSSVNASGVMSDTTVQASFTPTLIPLASTTFANGIIANIGTGFKIVTAGQYLAVGLAFFGGATDASQYRTMIYVNGLAVLTKYQYNGASYNYVDAIAVGILNLNAGDNVQLYGETGSASTKSVTGANSYLSICKV